MLKVRFMLNVLFVFWLGMPVLAATEDPDVWRFGLEEIDGSVQDIYAQEFKKRVEEKSGGSVLVDIYSYGTLGESEDLTALTALGTLQLSHASVGIIGNLVPEMQVFNIPFIYSHDDKLNQNVIAREPLIYEIIGNAMIDHGLRLMTLYLEGEMVWSTNTPVRSARDLEGFRMRVMNSPLEIDAFRLYGSDPIPLPYSQVYGALQANIIDGQTNPVFSIEEMKFYEVTDYLIWSGKQKFTTSVIANQEWYLSLSAAHKQVLRETIEELTDFIFDQQTALNKAELTEIKRSKPSMTFITLSRAQRNALKKLSEPIRTRYLELAGSQGARLLDALDSEFSGKK